MNDIEKSVSTESAPTAMRVIAEPSLALVSDQKEIDTPQKKASQQYWQEQKIAVQKRWLMLHADELNTMDGSAEPLIELVSSRYALSQAEAETQVRQFFANYKPLNIPDVFNGQWEQHVASARSRWTKLNVAELQQSKGNKQVLVNLVRRRYGLTPDEARKQVTQFITRCTFDYNKRT